MTKDSSLRAKQRKLVLYNGARISLRDLFSVGRILQEKAMAKKLAGEHKVAVELYHELLRVVRALEAAEAFQMLPSGMSEQLVLRAIELTETEMGAEAQS